MSQKAGRLRKSVAFPFFYTNEKNVAAVYMGTGFSKIRWKNLILLSILFGGIQLGTLFR